MSVSEGSIWQVGASTLRRVLCHVDGIGLTVFLLFVGLFLVSLGSLAHPFLNGYDFLPVERPDHPRALLGLSFSTKTMASLIFWTAFSCSVGLEGHRIDLLRVKKIHISRWLCPLSTALVALSYALYTLGRSVLLLERSCCRQIQGKSAPKQAWRTLSTWGRCSLVGYRLLTKGLFPVVWAVLYSRFALGESVKNASQHSQFESYREKRLSKRFSAEKLRLALGSFWKMAQKLKSKTWAETLSDSFFNVVYLMFYRSSRHWLLLPLMMQCCFPLFNFQWTYHHVT